MSVYGWSLSGVDPKRWTIVQGTFWRPPVSVHRSVVTVPGRHGSLPSRRPPVFEEPTVTLRLLASEFGGLPGEVAAQELRNVLASPEVALTRVVDGEEQSARVELVSIGTEPSGPSQPPILDAVLAVPGVFFRGSVVSGFASAVSNGSTVSVSHLAVGSGPVGDAVLRFRGPLTSVSVADEASGTGISWEGSLTEGQYLYLLPESLTARRSTSSSAWASGGSNVTGGVDYPPSGVLQLWPVMVDAAEPGVRDVRLRVEGAGFGQTSSLLVRGAPAYL